MSQQSVVGRILSDVVGLFLLLLFVRWIADLVLTLGRSRPPAWLIPVLELTYTVTDPPLQFLRRLIPPLRIGNMAIDLAFTVLVVGLLVVQSTALTRI
jgi:YggT family protein